MLIIDSNYLCWRSYYTTGELSYKEVKTGVIFTFLNQVLNLAKKFKTSDFVFCWDSKKSYRKILYPEYKANRKKSDLTQAEKENLDNAYRQFDLLRKEVLSDLGFSNVFHVTGFEGDDLIAKVIKDVGLKPDIIVVSSDNDLFQLLNFGKQVSLYELKKKELMGFDDFIKKYNFAPSLYAEAKAIGGCNGDNVKGVQGVGDPKSETSKAITFLNNQLSAGKIKDRILSKEGQEIIERNRVLVKLPFEVGSWKLPEFEIQENNFSKEKFVEVFGRYDFRSFLKRLDQWKVFYK